MHGNWTCEPRNNIRNFVTLYLCLYYIIDLSMDLYFLNFLVNPSLLQFFNLPGHRFSLWHSISFRRCLRIVLSFVMCQRFVKRNGLISHRVPPRKIFYSGAPKFRAQDSEVPLSVSFLVLYEGGRNTGRWWRWANAEPVTRFPCQSALRSHSVSWTGLCWFFFPRKWWLTVKAINEMFYDGQGVGSTITTDIMAKDPKPQSTE